MPPRVHKSRRFVDVPVCAMLAELEPRIVSFFSSPTFSFLLHIDIAIGARTALFLLRSIPLVDDFSATKTGTAMAKGIYLLDR